MLTALTCKNARCPEGKLRQRLADSAGLYLEVASTGSKRWFVKYRFGGKERRLALGSFPDVSLTEARDERDEARKILKAGTDPVQRRKLDKLTRKASAAVTFEAVARDCHATKSSGWSPQYGQRWIERMEKDLFPRIGSLPLAEITAPLLLSVLKKVEDRGAKETAHTLRKTAGQVFRFGIATGRCIQNPAPDLHGALKPVIVRHMPALLDPVQVGGLMRAIDGYQGQPTTRAALMLSALLFQRPGNIRAMEWSDIDLDKALWSIPSDKMKRTKQGKASGRPHLVPLAPQAVQILREVHPISGHGRYVFPSLHTHDRPMSENTVNTALRRMGYSGDEMTAHGFRSMARTILVERTQIAGDVIEAQLAHGKSGPLGRRMTELSSSSSGEA
jgi:integrase